MRANFKLQQGPARTRSVRDGFVALTSTIIISAVLLVLVTSVASRSYSGRFNVLDTELKKMSIALAEACVEIALLKHAKDDTYDTSGTFPDEVVVGERVCNIESVTESGGIATIEAWAEVRDIRTNLEVELHTTDYTVNSWQEVQNFTP